MAFQSALADATELYEQEDNRGELSREGYVYVKIPGRIRNALALPFKETKQGYYYPAWVAGVWDSFKNNGDPDSVNRAIEELEGVRGDVKRQRMVAADMLLSGAYPALKAALTAMSAQGIDHT